LPFPFDEAVSLRSLLVDIDSNRITLSADEALSFRWREKKAVTPEGVTAQERVHQ
jgi:hypothetical protein